MIAVGASCWCAPDGDSWSACAQTVDGAKPGHIIGIHAMHTVPDADTGEIVTRAGVTVLLWPHPAEGKKRIRRPELATVVVTDEHTQTGPVRGHDRQVTDLAAYLGSVRRFDSRTRELAAVLHALIHASHPASRAA